MTVLRRSSVLAAALAVAALAGCGATGQPKASPLDWDAATQEALNAVALARSNPDDPLYGHALHLGRVGRGPLGHWLVRVDDRTAGSTVCVDVGRLSTRIEDCPAPSAPPPPPETRTQPSA